MIIAGGVVVLAVACGLIARARNGRRRAGGPTRVRPEDLDGRRLAEVATLVQFSTELCTRCPQVRRLLRGIAEEYDGVAHAEIDLTHRSDLATRHRVLQTPTTFLVDASGAVLARWGGVPDRRSIDEALASVHTAVPDRAAVPDRLEQS
nr:thioredoxin family protein [Microbacterium ginsengiterrae]